MICGCVTVLHSLESLSKSHTEKAVPLRPEFFINERPIAPDFPIEQNVCGTLEHVRGKLALVNASPYIRTVLSDV